MERWSQCTYRCVVLPDFAAVMIVFGVAKSQCTYRCVVLPDAGIPTMTWAFLASQCTCRCVVLPDTMARRVRASTAQSLNAPTGAWCSLTSRSPPCRVRRGWSQCTYRCVVLPDVIPLSDSVIEAVRLNAPTGAWCSLTPALGSGGMTPLRGPGAPPAPGAPLRTGQHRAQSST